MSGSNCKVNFILYGGNHLRQGNVSEIHFLNAAQGWREENSKISSP